jgi:chromosome segregation ATPase
MEFERSARVPMRSTDRITTTDYYEFIRQSDSNQIAHELAALSEALNLAVAESEKLKLEEIEPLKNALTDAEEQLECCREDYNNLEAKWENRIDDHNDTGSGADGENMLERTGGFGEQPQWEELSSENVKLREKLLDLENSMEKLAETHRKNTNALQQEFDRKFKDTLGEFHKKTVEIVETNNRLQSELYNQQRMNETVKPEPNFLLTPK